MASTSPNYGACSCGSRGELVTVSPSLLNGGNSRFGWYTITDQNMNTHEFFSEWDDEEGRYVTTCLRLITSN